MDRHGRPACWAWISGLAGAEALWAAEATADTKMSKVAARPAAAMESRNLQPRQRPIQDFSGEFWIAFRNVSIVERLQQDLRRWEIPDSEEAHLLPVNYLGLLSSKPEDSRTGIHSFPPKLMNMRSKTRFTIRFAARFVSSLCVVAFAIPSGAQAPAAQASAAPATTLKVQVNEVILPVTVRDKKGQIVPNLKQDDFVLQEDGRPETIKSFSHETNLPFRLGLLVDTSRSQENALPGERSATGKFIDQMLSQPVDKAFLLHFDHEVELLQDFTASKPKLHHELY